MGMTIVGVVALTIGVLLAVMVFVLSSLSGKFTVKDRVELYGTALVLYVGGCYAVFSSAPPWA